MKKIFASMLLITLVIATFSFAMFITPGVKAQVQEANVVSYTWYIAPNDTASAQYPGDLIVVGEIQNIGSNIIGNLSAVAFAYDSSNNLLSQQGNQVFGSDIPPNGKAPFYLDFQPQINSDYTRLNWESQVSNVTVFLTVPVDTTETQYSGLTISGTSGTTTITGTVQNTGSQTVGYTWVVATYYDASGKVVGVGNSVFVSILFHPGASGGFTVSPNDPTAVSNKITSHSLTVQSLSVAQSATPTPHPSTSTPTPNTSTTATPGTSTGSSASVAPPIELSITLLYGIIIALVVVIFIIVITMFLFMKRRKNASLSNLPPSSPPPALT